MKRTNYFAPTLREYPSDAIATSHKLMLRAGLIRMVSAGIYSYLPLGWSAVQKTSRIVREEMNRIGGQELLLPSMTPINLWNETGRNKDFGDEMFRLSDRKGQIYSLAPTHEEIICSTARGQIRSWRDLPQIWYQIQTKFRDEPRPRGGMLRARQFLMKDAYSLDRDENGLNRSYEMHQTAYNRIFERCGLNFFVVGASSGLMGGGQSQEFMIESEAGEDEIVRCEHCGYSSNIEVASSKSEPISCGKAETLREVSTPDQRTVEEVSKFLGVPQSRMIKTLVYFAGKKPVIALVSGEDELSESKFTRIAGDQVRPADGEEVLEYMKAEIGFLGPHGNHKLPIFADFRLKNTIGMVTGANRTDYHVMGLDLERDVKPTEYADLRQVRAGENCPECEKDIRMFKAIEIGHIFKLGTKYSLAMSADFLNKKGEKLPIVMGSYGIGIDRILAANIEQNADKDGIRWHNSIAPIEVCVIPLADDDNIVISATQIYSQLREAGFSVLLDDRSARPGVKLKDADLLGIPVHVVVSSRNLSKDQIEIKNRWDGERFYVSPQEVNAEVEKLLK
ncbi:MAG: proline--tRNA ligase [Calditrichaeota bacterium]|nr:proline--tRNA ligase [Calditrichota bacterium]